MEVPCSPTPHSLVGQLGWQREPGAGNCWQDLPMKLLPLPASCHVVRGPLGTCASFSEEMGHPSPTVWGSHPVPQNTGHTQMRHWSGLLEHGREWTWGKCLQRICNMASPLCRAAGNSTRPAWRWGVGGGGRVGQGNVGRAQGGEGCESAYQGGIQSHSLQPY